MAEATLIGFAVAAGGDEPAATALFDNVRQERSVPHTSFTPQVHLHGGAVVVGPISSGDPQRFEVESFPFSLPASSVTHILFRWLPLRYSAQLASGRSGVLLNTGEFIEA